MQALRSWMIALSCGLMIAGFLPVLPPIIAALSLGFVGAYAAVLGKRWHILFGGSCVGLCLGCLYGSALLSRQPAAACLVDEAVVTGSVVGLVDRREIRPEQNRQRFQFKVIRWQPLECSGPKQLLLSYYGDEPIAAGQQLELLIAARRNWGQVNPGSVSFQSWYAFAGIDVTGTVKSVIEGQALTPSVELGILAQLRTDLITRIRTADLPGESKALLKALVAGDKSGITSVMWQRFQLMGINHLFVISGLHIGLVAALGYGLGGGLCRVIQLLRGPHLLAVAPICSLVCAYAYAGLAGFSLSTQRALLMTGCFLLASMLSRASQSWQGLLIAASGVLLVNPLSMLSAGFWLSFVAVAWLLWIGPFLGGGYQPVRPHVRIVRLVGLHGSLCLLMFPLTLWWFGGASVLSPVVNFVFVPLVSLYVVPLVLVGTVMAALDLPLWALVWEGALWPLTTLLTLLEQVTPALSQLYWTGATQVLDVALALAGLVLWPLCVNFRSRILTLVLFVPVLLPGAIGEGSVSASFLDVGQGTAVVIQSGDRVLVYDTGGGDPRGHNRARSVIVPFLRSRGVTQIDTLVVSHPDLDHSAGVTTLLAQFPVRHAYASQPVQGLDNASLCRTGLAFAWPEGVLFQFLAPSEPANHSSNDASCVLRITLSNQEVVLLPGDIGVARELDIVRFWGNQLNSDYLLAAHHGSRTSTSPAWLKWVSPRVVILTHGQANPFGHPHDDVVRRIRREGLMLESTAERGALLFEQVDSGHVALHGWRQRQRFYWL
ncbi:MAG: DNA internalization-related competence protein ComEC/Rec2 [Halioglobus sp.]